MRLLIPVVIACSYFSNLPTSCGYWPPINYIRKPELGTKANISLIADATQTDRQHEKERASDQPEPVNSGIDPIWLPIAAVLAVLGYKVIKSLLIAYGNRIARKPEELKEIVDTFLEKTYDSLGIDTPLKELKADIHSKIDSGIIKTPNDIIKYFEK